MSSLAILLPLTSKSPFVGSAGSSRLLEGLQCLRDSLGDGAAKTAVVIGIDEDDTQILDLLPEIRRCFSGVGLSPEGRIKVEIRRCFGGVGLSAEGGIRVETFTRAELDEHPPGPICWMWDRLARSAIDGVSGGDRPDLLLLLGAMNPMMCHELDPARPPSVMWPRLHSALINGRLLLPTPFTQGTTPS